MTIATPHHEHYYNTRSMCPQCEKLVPAKVLAEGGKVLVRRTCPEHGDFDGLVCSDVAWWEDLPRFTVEGVRPKSPVAGQRGCPDDCGLCPQHLQIAGTAAVEISNRCNNDCPTCLADNQESFELGVSDVVAALERVLQNQERVDVFTLSGGEPTIHPQLFEMIEALQRPEVGRISINSNGIRIAEDDAFLERLAQQDNIYICLHYDGAGAQQLRGVDFEVQRRALQRLGQAGVDVVPLVLAAQGVNDEKLGPLVAELLREPTVRSVILSMMTYTGRRGAGFAGDPLTRLTIPAALDQMERTSSGVLHRRDFMPLTMPNPMCAAIGYFLVTGEAVDPLIPLGDLDRIIEYTKNGSFGGVTDEFEQFLTEAIDRVYAAPEGDSEALLGRFRALLEALFPPDGAPLEAEARRKAAEERIKSVYLMQFIDPWTFDARRLTRCSCQHVLPDGKIVASCGYYAYHRRFDPRFEASSQPT
jgi:uncharacterized radical SAM superfamily Fe-S cluster-containing enzyme